MTRTIVSLALRAGSWLQWPPRRRRRTTPCRRRRGAIRICRASGRASSWSACRCSGTRQLGTRNVLTEEEFKQAQERFARQAAQDEAEFDLDAATSTPGGDVGGPVSPPPHWLERGKPQYIASLIVDPPDGRMPPLTPEAQQRNQAAQAAAQVSRGRGPADSYTDRSLYDRCITRGIAGSFLPVIYNNGNEIVQGPGWVALRNEMIHETRIVPLDSRPRLAVRDQVLDGRLARALGRRTRWSSRPPTSTTARRASASTAAATVTRKR